LRKVCDQLIESSDGAQYFLNPGSNMVTAAMMLRFIPEPDEPEAMEMYQNLPNLVERATMQQAEIDQYFPLGTESYGLQTTSSWSRRAQ
jgi:hypothetical protein